MEIKNASFLTSSSEPSQCPAPDNPEFSALVEQLRSESTKLLNLVQPLRGPLVAKLRTLLQDNDLPQKLDALAILLQPSKDEKHAVLQATEPKERIQTVIQMITKRITVRSEKSPIRKK